MLFIGHTKFSVYTPTSGAWRATNGSKFRSEEEYRAYLFSGLRLDPRIDILINFSLPQLALAAKNHQIVHLLSYSELLPRKYEQLLIDASDKYEFIQLNKQRLGTGWKTAEQIAPDLLLTSEHPQQPFGIYRLDDDDILPADYFDQISPYVKEEFVGMQVSLGTGVSAIYKDGQFYNARKTYHPMLSIGYTSIHKMNGNGEISKFPVSAHNLADRKYPVILDSRRLGYLWTRHTQQDTALGLLETDESSLNEALKRHMDRHPAVHDLDELFSSFPILENKITAAGSPKSTREEMITKSTELDHLGLRLKPKRVGGRVKVTVTMTCSIDSVPRNALLKFIFVNKDGRRIDPKTLDQYFENQPISRSGNARVGWFRYLSTRPGKNKTVIDVTLPPNVCIGVVSVTKWVRNETRISINSISVESISE
ncbi:glycosyltransferase [Arthrobacter sp. NIO-1057]|uniref:glycosyltransferase n=1 Tax=Arthrobacter sp. NIO-1057 TaxID=993071 RepID=UPI00071C7894|nr:glycosyltransferase [Arthrobacter sp. NIO-1057]KSU67698.1 hypothetical protein AS038_00910 [Arthrobacter sp. NIO-1057]SCB76397.1 Putative rhamnosyl transferase [Arthrobacter sp. NIO-1057]